DWCAISDWQVRARGLNLCLGHTGGFDHRIAGLDSGAPVRFDLLRVARHADSTSLCGDQSSAHHGAWLPLRDTAAAGNWIGSKMGSSGINRVGWNRGLDRVCFAAKKSKQTHRTYRLAHWLPVKALAGGSSWSRLWLGHQARN